MTLVFENISGKEGSVSEEMVSIGIHTNLLAEFSPNHIFNADETGLFWKCLPDNTFTLKGEKCSGGKKSKQRLAVLVCANTSGVRSCLCW